MAQIHKADNEYIGVKSIQLSSTNNLVLGRIATSGSIAGGAGGLSTIYTVPTGPNVEIHLIKVRCVGGSGITGTLIASVGTGGGANNILPSTTFTGLSNPGDLWVAPLSGIVHVAVPTDVISFNITNPVGGTTPLFEVSLYGEYV